jgi:outer membrane receptor for ferrienterochelin and colicin
MFSNIIIAQDTMSNYDINYLSLSDMVSIEVSTTSRKIEKQSDAPAIISTFNKEEIKAFGAENLSEFLTYFTSTLPVEGPFRNNLLVRGDKFSLDANHILILLDGVPISREGYTGGIFTTPLYKSFPISSIEQIEFIRSTSSVMYGTSAYAGVVNIITKKNG